MKTNMMRVWTED